MGCKVPHANIRAPLESRKTKLRRNPLLADTYSHSSPVQPIIKELKKVSRGNE